MMLKPASMSRVRLIIGQAHADDVLSALQDVGVMQVEQLPQELATVLTRNVVRDKSGISDLAQRFRSLEGLLEPQGHGERVSFGSIDELIRKANAIDIDEQCAGIFRRSEALGANIAYNEVLLRVVSGLRAFDKDLNVLSTKLISSYVVYGPQIERFRKELEGKGIAFNTIDLSDSIIVSIRKSEYKAFSVFAAPFKVYMEAVPKMEGTVSENMRRLKESMARDEKELHALDNEKKELSRKYFHRVSAIREQLDIELERVETLSKLGATESTVAMEGWIPRSNLSALEALISKITGRVYVMENDIPTKEQPPTKMENPVTMRLYEFFIRFYSVPKSNEIDPTVMFALIFPVFFGFMIGDAGYGLVMLLGAIWLVHRIEHPPKRSRLPAKLTGFIKTIIGPNGMRVVAKSIIPGAVIAIALGLLFNEFFGFKMPYTAPFDVVKNVGTLLVISGWIGVFMVSFGFILGILNNIAVGNRKHALGKVGWLAAAIGIVIFGLNVLHKANLGPGNIIALISYALLGAGIAVIFIEEGAQSLMELPSLISHILSYTRLVGILLASVILAEVIDLIFMAGIRHSILLGLLGVVILVVGQIFNLVIALFEPGIQGARLIYVEFFSKFYTGNGKEFRPFAYKRQRTEPKFKL